MIYGSGLGSGDFNLDRVVPYGQVNVGMSREITAETSRYCAV
jgi:hypothetical protein